MAERAEGVTPVCGIARTENLSDRSFPVYSSFKNVKTLPDAIIDFSSPEVLEELLSFAEENGIPAVLCVTGYTESQLKRINAAAEKTAIFLSSNTSLGVYVLRRAVSLAAKELKDFDAEIIEIHHAAKKDAPSGTALALANDVKSARENAAFVFGRKGYAPRDKNEIGVHSVRGGNVTGEHTVIFAGENETLSFTHSATDKSVFAAGAIKAAIFVSDKKRGLYGMKDLFGE